MFKKKLIPLVVATALVGCTGDDKAELDGNTRGSVAISGSDFFAGATLSATVTDADGIDGEITYAWSTGVTGDTYTITEADEGTVVSVSANYTDNAGFTEGVGASTPMINPTLNVTANVVKGPVSGASCDIFAIDDDGAAVSPAQATATTADTGEVTFSDVHFEGYGLVSCTGGTYTDESTGEILDAPMLRAVVDVVENIIDENGVVQPPPTYVVSPLTEMAVQSAGADLNSFATVIDAINARFGIRFDVTEVAPTTVGVDALGADGADNADRYGSVLALLSQLDADDADKDLAAILADLVADIADGTYSEATLDAFEMAQTNLQTTSEVASDVDVSLLDAIGAAVGYNNDPVVAIIGGVLSATVQNTETDTYTASATVTDPNFEEDAFIAQTDVVLDYGTFSITEDGEWSYTVDTTNDIVASLEVGSSVNDIITISTIDGTTADIDVRIAALTQVVKISDTGDDTGEIRFAVNNLRQGKLSASFSKEAALGSDGNNKDAYISLYGSSGSSSESLIDLRIQGSQTDADGNPIDPRFLVRNTDSDDYPGIMITAPFVEEQFYNVEIAWDLDATEQLTVTIDGEVIGGGSFSTAAVVDSDFTDLDQWFADGVQVIQFRFGDNSRTIPFGSFYVDNIEVYSDTDGTVSVFEDDFENYDEGDTLNGDSSLYGLAIYSEVVVFDVGDGSAEPTPAAFFDLTATVASDTTVPLTGTVSVIDPDAGEAFIIESTITGTYGVLTILEDGSWTYTLDTADPTIAALEVGQRETDTITIESVDGTTAELVITINGTIVVDTGSDKAVRITDSSTEDAGELRYKPDEAILKGRMTATIQREAGAKAEDPSEDAQIAIFGSSTSTSNAMAYISLDISGDDYDLRADGSSSGGGSTAGFQEGQDIDFEISWDATSASDTVAPLVTVTIDGQVAFEGEFSSPSADLGSVQGGVETIFFRIGGTSDVTAFGLLVDDFTVYSSDSGSEVEVFTDDFESYTVGNSLDPNADTADTAPIAGAIVEASTPYDSNSFEAFVVETGSTEENSQFAIITDSSSEDAGELRFKPDDAIVKGRFTATVQREAGAKAEDPSEDAQIAIFGSSTSTSNAMAYISLDISGDDYDLRADGSSSGGGSTAGFQEGQDIDFEISWDASAANDTVAPLVTVTIDGQVAFEGEFSSPSADLGSVQGGVETIFFRIGGTSDVTAFGLMVDDFKVYSSDSGSEVEVFSDSFETYTVGNSLDPNADTADTAPIAGAIVEANTPYDSNSFEVVVGER
ncbi:VCBS domain-containing protein [Aliiglaciecola sp. 2_MG-2023]|uniref:VCBS domain-containing protein n=1 Tax=unclassified Aliiglaciecola TaxID=2593648 RepID=UPI0026E38069|nr:MULTISPECIES: VCBS domain-containing protein [unclassified Aliiglaciecola]MDO6712513.1 VCBS domain-containing protein [Aliiglaciecola sp. 2_MG-2023]MDO6753429.1 VCBS domain-containing protein [Aliiglaciecola sp. 1_MG-2023]